MEYKILSFREKQKFEDEINKYSDLGWKIKSDSFQVTENTIDYNVIYSVIMEGIKK